MIVKTVSKTLGRRTILSDGPNAPRRETKAVILKGVRIREDANGLLCLNDIYRAARQPKNQGPNQWHRLPSVQKVIVALYEKTVGKFHSSGKIRISSIFYTRAGFNGGTYAHAILAAAYAEYLSPKLAIEIKGIWLRYRAGDPKLADEILERASEEGNRWAAARAIGRIQRRRFTDVLQSALVSPKGYALCTNEIYRRLFDRTAKQMKKAKNVLVLRDAMDVVELAQITLSEGMAAERIVEESRRGDLECVQASGIAAGFVRDAVEKERASRRPRLDL